VLALYWLLSSFDYKVVGMNWQEFTALLVLATAMSFSPGPNTTLSTALAANHGLRRTMPFICSVPLGWGALLCLCALGLGALLLAVPLLGLAVRLAGVVYLLYLAARLVGFRLSLQNGRVQANWNRGGAAAGDDSRPDRPTVTFWQGAGLQFLNIKAWMLALAIVSGWIVGRNDAAERMAVVLPVMLLFAFASNLTYALIGSLLKNWLAGPHRTGRRLVWFNRAMAAVLIATAAWMMVI
jgi:threonine/homoserine/homoserine lactone efflux protein